MASAVTAKVLLALAIATASAGAGVPAEAATGADHEVRPVLLLFHPGAFVFGDTAQLDRAVQIASDDGFKAIAVDYPLQDLHAAVRYTRRTASRFSRKGRPVYAYGESAGGTLAALLAESGAAEAVATYSQVTNLIQFTKQAPDPAFYQASIAATSIDLHRFSPAFGHAVSPVLALTPRLDLPYLSRATLSWGDRNELVRTRSVAGGHVGDGDPRDVYSANVERALGWLARQAGS